MSAPVAIRGWAYAFDDDRSPPVTTVRAKPIEEAAVEPAPAKQHCPYCHTLLVRGVDVVVCADLVCAKKLARDNNTRRLDRAQQQAGGGIVQRGKNRQ